MFFCNKQYIQKIHNLYLYIIERVLISKITTPDYVLVTMYRHTKRVFFKIKILKRY